MRKYYHQNGAIVFQATLLSTAHRVDPEHPVEKMIPSSASRRPSSKSNHVGVRGLQDQADAFSDRVESTIQTQFENTQIVSTFYSWDGGVCANERK